MKNTILVTGGAGFIGSHVVDALISNGHSVVVLDDLSGGFSENVNPKAIFIAGSINDKKLIDSLFYIFHFTHVYHLAAYAAEGLSHFIKDFNYTNNLLGSTNLITAAINYDVKCFVFTSSIAVYGKNQLPMREDLTPLPEDSYGIAKYAVELELKASHEMFGLPYVIFRPHNVYGERQNIGDKYRNVLGIFMNQIMQNLPLSIFGDGMQKRAFTYIGDIAPIIAQAGLNPAVYNDIYNIGADTATTVNDLAGIIANAMGVEAQINHLPARNEVVEAYADHTKAQAKLGYITKTSLTEGIYRMAAWAKQMGPRKSKNFEGIEIEKNLPPSWKAQ